MTFFRWSRVKDTNNTADSTCPFPEGQSPSSLNDGSRGQMAALAKWRDDISGAILTGGTSAAYTVSSYQGFDSLTSLHNQLIAFTPHTSNVDTVLLNTDGLGNKPLRLSPGVELPKGTLVQGTPYLALYNNTDGAFYLRGGFSSPYDIPFLGGVEYWDTVAPSSAFIFPVGQALSRSVYAAVYARWGTQFGAGDGSTTFNAPDKRGRISAAADNMGGVASGTLVGVNFGNRAGSAANTLSQANLPNVAPSFVGNAGGVSVNATTGNLLKNDLTMNIQGGSTYSGVFGSNTNTSLVSTGSFTPTGGITSINGGVAQTAFSICPPVIGCNYIIRVL